MVPGSGSWELDDVRLELLTAGKTQPAHRGRGTGTAAGGSSGCVPAQTRKKINNLDADREHFPPNTGPIMRVMFVELSHDQSD